MKRALSACLFSIALLFPFAASAQAPLVRFDSGIGVVPVRAGPAANTRSRCEPWRATMGHFPLARRHKDRWPDLG